MNHPVYPETLLDHFRRPRNVGEVVRPDAEGRGVSPIHGDAIRLTFAIRGDLITQVRFQCYGCVVAIAAGSVATTLLTDRTLEEALALSNDRISAALGGVPESKRRCSLVVQEAVESALGALGG